MLGTIFFNAYDTDKAYADFLLTLNKEPFEPNAAMQKGIEFENAVAAYCRGGVAEDTEKEVGDIVKGGQFQVVAYKDVKIDPAWTSSFIRKWTYSKRG